MKKIISTISVVTMLFVSSVMMTSIAKAGAAAGNFATLNLDQIGSLYLILNM